MSPSTTDPTVTELIGAVVTASPENLDTEYRRLVDAVWKDGALTGLAPAAAPALVACLDGVDAHRQGRLAVLLGLLAEAEYPAADGEVTAAVAAGVDRYLELLRDSAPGEPLSLALFYLLAHFPGARDRTLALAAAHGLTREDHSLLDRALQQLDPQRPVLGRVFPSPAEWPLDDGERAYDQGWIAALTPEQVEQNWHNDTRTVLGNIGAKAHWSVGNGAPRVLASVPAPTRDSVPVPPAGVAADLFAAHSEALRCPHCRARLDIADSGVTCTGCERRYPVAGGVVNFFAEAGSGGGSDDDFLKKLSEIPTMGLFYEALARPAFLRLCGSNWGGAVTLPDEDAYIAGHVHPVDGPVLDLAAGAGRWTEVLARTVGTERLIALDVNPAMINVLRGRLPQVPAVLAGGDTLPFADASLGAVMCWNALQAFPDQAPAAIAEVGRCLKPGGTFTVLTFRRPEDPIYRYFQFCHRFPQHQEGLRLLDLDELKGWLARAGLAVQEESYPGTFVLLTAVRQD